MTYLQCSETEVIIVCCIVLTIFRQLKMLNEPGRSVSGDFSGLQVKWFGSKKFKFFRIENIVALILILSDFGLNESKRTISQTSQIINLRAKF